MIGIGSSLLRPPQHPYSQRSSTRTHKRESSLSTNASTASSQSRVLPFATASTRAMRIAPPIGEGTSMAAIAEHPASFLAESPLPPANNSKRKPLGLVGLEAKRESLPTITINGAETATVSGQTYYPALGHPRFALAKPRRVITVNGAIASSNEPLDFSRRRCRPRDISGPQRQQNRKVRASISLHSMLPPLSEPKRHIGSSSNVSNGSSSSLGGTRTRPIIGLGLTLNPADALVTIQPRSRALRTRVPKMLTPVRSSGCLETKCTHIAWSPVPEDYAVENHQSEALLDKAFKCVSFESLRSAHSDSSSISGAHPMLVALSDDDTKEEATAADLDSVAAPSELLLLSREQVARKPSVDELLPVAVTCILCFERVLLSQKRSYLLRCPGCGNGLERPSDNQSLMHPHPAEPWSLTSTLRSQQEQQPKRSIPCLPYSARAHV
ncbi:hypothetical protein LPJ59_000121 [Coemansia sp. RSA 2399]|nr:hypothetical protein LPJ59_000121 [Coemansia sp. RSA 2399]KAJ1908403.1 hypothetical protein LPJ81_000112 [Coemansia sp. IMI 209127]